MQLITNERQQISRLKFMNITLWFSVNTRWDVDAATLLVCNVVVRLIGSDNLPLAHVSFLFLAFLMKNEFLVYIIIHTYKIMILYWFYIFAIIAFKSETVENRCQSVVVKYHVWMYIFKHENAFEGKLNITLSTTMTLATNAECFFFVLVSFLPLSLSASYSFSQFLCFPW